MFIGWMVCSLSAFSLLLLSDLKRYEEVDRNGDDDDGAKGGTTYMPGYNAPSIPFLSFIVLMCGTGVWLADVMADSLVAEKSKFEQPDRRGQLLSTCYACRFFGLMVAAPFSTVIYSQFGPGVVVCLMGLIPLMMIPLIAMLGERKNAEVKRTDEQCGEIGGLCAVVPFGNPWDLSTCTTFYRSPMLHGKNF